MIDMSSIRCFVIFLLCLYSKSLSAQSCRDFLDPVKQKFEMHLSLLNDSVDNVAKDFYESYADRIDSLIIDSVFHVEDASFLEQNSIGIMNYECVDCNSVYASLERLRIAHRAYKGEFERASKSKVKSYVDDFERVNRELENTVIIVRSDCIARQNRDSIQENISEIDTNQLDIVAIESRIEKDSLRLDSLYKANFDRIILLEDCCTEVCNDLVLHKEKQKKVNIVIGIISVTALVTSIVSILQ